MGSRTVSRKLRWAAAAALAVAGCLGRGERVAYRFAAADSLAWELDADLSATAASGGPAYRAETRAWLRARPQAAKDGYLLQISVDSLRYRGDERDSAENVYMSERMRKFRARLLLDSTGRVRWLETDLDMPPQEFSGLDLGRLLLYALPAFPERPVGVGARWETDQPLFDKLHPKAIAHKAFTVASREGEGPASALRLEFGFRSPAEEVSDSGKAARALSGKGWAVFRPEPGRVDSAGLTLELETAVRPAGLDTAAMPLRLHQEIRLRSR